MSLGGKERRDFTSVIPDDLKLFEPADIKRAFDYLEKTFRLNRDWYADFKKELLRRERGMSEQEFFFRYTCKHIDPALQRILRREDSVIVALARYLIRDKIVERKKEAKALRNYYQTDQWRKGKV
jgi:hypothetical protein